MKFVIVDAGGEILNRDYMKDSMRAVRTAPLVEKWETC